jgi:hypothetical protein
LGCLPAQDAHDIPHLHVDPAGELLDVHRGGLPDRLEPLKLGLERLLPGRLGTEARPKVFLGQRAVCEGIDQPVEPLLDLSEFPLGLGTPVELGTLALRQGGDRLLHSQRENRGIERVDDGAQDRPLKKILANNDRVRADRLAPSLVVQTCVVMDDRPLRRCLAMAANLGSDRPAAAGATGEPY